MDHEQLLHWLATTDLEHLEHSHTLALVRAAIASLESLDDEDLDSFDKPEEMLDALEPILEELQSGGLPREALRALALKFRPPSSSGEPPALVLEREMRALAEELDDDEWCTPSYLMVESGVDLFLDEGNETPLLEALESMSQTLEAAYKPYREARVLEAEVTAESYVGHKLLQEGIEAWLSALEMLRQEEVGDAAEDDDESEAHAGWTDALGLAEQGNRLLIAVQKLNLRIQDQVASADA